MKWLARMADERPVATYLVTMGIVFGIAAVLAVTIP